MLRGEPKPGLITSLLVITLLSVGYLNLKFGREENDAQKKRKGWLMMGSGLLVGILGSALILWFRL